MPNAVAYTATYLPMCTQKSPRIVPGFDWACAGDITCMFKASPLYGNQWLLTGSVSPSICRPVLTTPNPSHTWRQTHKQLRARTTADTNTGRTKVLQNGELRSFCLLSLFVYSNSPLHQNGHPESTRVMNWSRGFHQTTLEECSSGVSVQCLTS